MCVWLVLAGSPHDPVARSLALDLDRRGFIVFVAVSTVEDEQVVINEGRADVRPLNIDILDVCKEILSLLRSAVLFCFFVCFPAHSIPVL